MKTKCDYADKYKGIRKPTCGCEVCELKWELAEKTRKVEDLQRIITRIGHCYHCSSHEGGECDCFIAEAMGD